jgi:hypothetical protein
MRVGPLTVCRFRHPFAARVKQSETRGPRIAQQNVANTHSPVWAQSGLRRSTRRGD